MVGGWLVTGVRPTDGEPAPPSRDELILDLKVLRQRGLLRCAATDLPALRTVAVLRGFATAPNLENAGVEHLLRTAVAALGEEEPGRAAQYLFGLVQGTAGRRPKDLREAAANTFAGLSPETFRKHHEPLLLGRIADEMQLPLQGAASVAWHPRPQRSPDGAAPVHQDLADLEWRLTRGLEAAAAHRYGPYRIDLGRGRSHLVVDLGPVEELTDVQIVVSSENTYLLPARPFSDSMSGALRKASALRGPDGGLIDDVVARELASWLAANGRAGGPVEPGVVAPTSAGNLSRSGVISLFHAAVAIPRVGQQGYQVTRPAVSAAVTRCFELARQLREREGAGVEAMSFPLFGAGHAGTSPAAVIAWLWAAVRRELHHDPSWRIHVTTMDPAQTREVLAVIAAATPRDRQGQQ